MRKREKKTLTYEGVTRTLREWHVATGIKLTTLYSRFDSGDWTPAQILGVEKREDRKASVKTITYNGRRQTIVGWSHWLNIPRSTIESRYNSKSNYTPAQILGFEPLGKRQMIKRGLYTRSDGKCHTVEDWAKILGRAQSTLRARLRRRWTIDETFELTVHVRGYHKHQDGAERAKATPPAHKKQAPGKAAAGQGGSAEKSS